MAKYRVEVPCLVYRMVEVECVDVGDVHTEAADQVRKEFPDVESIEYNDVFYVKEIEPEGK